MTHGTEDRRYIRATLSFTECDAKGSPLPGAPVCERSDHIAVATERLTWARYPAHVWAHNAEHVAQFVAQQSSILGAAEAFGELMTAKLVHS